MTDHLAEHADEIKKDEARGMQGAQARVVNASQSGPRVLDSEIFEESTAVLRRVMGPKALTVAKSCFRALLCRVMVTIGRADIVNLNPFNEFSSAVQAATL